MESLEPRHMLTTFMVNTLVDEDGTYAVGDPSNSLREAITAAYSNPGDDTIEFAPNLQGSINLSSQLTINSNVSIVGPGMDELTIDAQGNSRVFRVNNGVTATISGLTMTDGSSGAGGAVYMEGNLTLDSVRVENSVSTGYGGGIYANGPLTLQSSIVAGNDAAGPGGGIYVEWTNYATIIDSTIDGNEAALGGGIFGYLNTGERLIVENSTISNNHATDAGGGVSIWNYNSSAPCIATFINTTISGNTAPWNGGLRIYGSQAHADLINSTIAYNQGDGSGSIALISSGTATLHNTIVSENKNAAGTTNSNLSYGNVNSSSSYNLIGPGGSGGLTNGTNGNIVLTTGQTAGLAPLGDYGGTTRTHALLEGSRGRDAGSLNVYSPVLGAPDFDQRGFSRVNGGSIDIGSVEMQVIPYLASGAALVEKYGTPSADTIVITDTSITINGESSALPISDDLVVFGLGGNDIIDASIASRNIRLMGGDDNDELQGGSGNDILEGGSGDDDLWGGPGNDLYIFDERQQTGSMGLDAVHEANGQGEDTLSFYSGSYGISLGLWMAEEQTVMGSASEPFLRLAAIHDQAIENVIGTPNEDFIYGNALNNNLIGGGGNDWLSGAEGDDTLEGGEGENFLFGGAGNDTYIVDDRFNSINSLSDTSGIDTIDLSRWTGPKGAKLDLAIPVGGYQGVSSPNGSSSGPSNPNSIWLTFQESEAIENIIGSPFNDELRGNSKANHIVGGDGNDSIYGLARDDQLYGGMGDDLLFGGNGHDMLFGEAGNDTLYGNEGDDVIDGGDGDDALIGGNGNDHLVGGNGEDTYDGGDGHDFTDGEGEDELHAPQFDSIPTITTRKDQPTAIRLLADDVENVHEQLVFTIDFEGEFSPFFLAGDILSIPPYGVPPGNYSATLTVTDTDNMTDTTALNLVITDFNDSPPDLGADPNWPAPWIINGLTINELPLDEPGFPGSSDYYHQFYGWDTQTSNENLVFGGRLTADGLLHIDWNEYVKTSSREVVEIQDDQGRNRKRAIFIHADDISETQDPNFVLITNPGMAVDDYFHSSGFDPYGPITLNLNANDLFESVFYGETPEYASVVYNNPSSLLAEFGTVTNFNESTGTFIFDPRDDFDGLITFEYEFSHPGIQLWDNTLLPVSNHIDSVQYIQSNTAIAQIHVGKAVRVNLTVEGVAEEEETQGYGVLLPLNDDDDNRNEVEDRRELKGPIAGEDDLTEITIDYWLRDDAYPTDYVAFFAVAGSVRLWTTSDKQQEILNGQGFLLAQLPSTVWAEGIERGGGVVEITLAGPSTSLFTDMVVPANFETLFSIDDTIHEDAIQFTVGLGLTAYRPMHGPNSYFPFKKTAVKEADEEDPKLGPGIRLNWDHDNGNSEVQDRIIIDGTSIPDENDMIEVRIDQLPGMSNLVLEVPSPLRIFTSYVGGTIIPVSGPNKRTAPLTFVDGVAKVFVEWSGDHGTAEVTLINGDDDFVIDKLTFHSFKGIVVGLSGEQLFDLGTSDALGSGVYTIATKLYEQGYDSYFYNEDAVGDSILPINHVFTEVISAIDDRRVQSIGIYGHSHGGGATYVLDATLISWYQFHGVFSIDLTAYIDAIHRPGPQPEERRPPRDVYSGATKGSKFHINYYQSTGFLHGVYIEEGSWSNPAMTWNIEVNEDVNWNDSNGNDLNHGTIDDSPELQFHFIGIVNVRVER